jgi:hypothetical protein
VAADEAVLNNVHKKKNPKNPLIHHKRILQQGFYMLLKFSSIICGFLNKKVKNYICFLEFDQIVFRMINYDFHIFLYVVKNGFHIRRVIVFFSIKIPKFFSPSNGLTLETRLS